MPYEPDFNPLGIVDAGFGPILRYHTLFLITQALQLQLSSFKVGGSRAEDRPRFLLRNQLRARPRKLEREQTPNVIINVNLSISFVVVCEKSRFDIFKCVDSCLMNLLRWFKPRCDV